MHGRKVLYTSEKEVTRDNVVSILTTALAYHVQNRVDTQRLYDYYRGKHDIFQRVKQYNAEICNKIVVNVPYQVVTFDTGYLMGEPVQYVSTSDSQDEVNQLNEFTRVEGREKRDKELADWFHICGTSYRMALPDEYNDPDESPFHIYQPDPRNTFVVYSTDLGNRPMLGVTYVTDTNGRIHYSCYSRDAMYEVVDGVSVVNEAPHDLEDVPIVEYPYNAARLGAFEIALEMCDALNLAESNRLDGVEQFVQSLMLFHNMDITSDDFAALKEQGALKYKDIDPQMKASVQYLTNELNQTETQTLVDDLYTNILTICGVPVRTGSSSTGDNGIAVVYRDGWAAAETNAKNAEMIYKESERRLLRIILRICKRMRGLVLRPSEVDIRFGRRNYDNIAVKAQVLTTMLDNPNIHPKLAFVHCGMFVDPDLAFTMSEEWKREHPTDTGDGEGDRVDSLTGIESGDTDRTGTDNDSRDQA